MGIIRSPSSAASQIPSLDWVHHWENLNLLHGTRPPAAVGFSGSPTLSLSSARSWCIGITRNTRGVAAVWPVYGLLPVEGTQFFVT